MTSMKKMLTPLMAFSIAIAVSSCNNSGDNKEDKKADETPVAAAFTPFKVIMIKHTVADYAKWKAGYIAHDSMRTAYGISKFVIGRGMDDSNMVYIVDKVTDLQKAKDFAASPSLKDAMQKAGVTGAPEISYATIVRFDSAAPDQKDRILVAHKVKDYDAWLKAYDGEGKATRLANGLQDRAIGRNADDSNLVYVTFVITDMAKAKARTASPELKKLMTDAGVVGPPAIFYYKVQ
jgi:hypothetical protein